MAKSSSSTKRLLIGIVVPIMVMVTVLTVVGVSFAWFSNATNTTIASIDVSTEKSFDLVFNISNLAGNPYNGQTAILGTDINAETKRFPIGADGGHLATMEWWNSHINLGGEYTSNVDVIKRYTDDMAYTAVFPLRMSTYGNTISFRITFVSVSIKKYRTDDMGRYLDQDNNVTEDLSQRVELTGLTVQLPSPDDSANSYTAEDISYGFTWYMYTNENPNLLYTPFGKITPAATPSLSQWDMGIPTTFSAWNEYKLNSGFNVVTQEDNTTNCNFCIVFAPERLFWMQYSQADYQKAKNQAYSAEELASPLWNYLNYTNEVYAGSEFQFKVYVEVVPEE